MKNIIFFILLTSLAACTNTHYSQIPSANHNDRIRFLVIHFTTIDYANSVKVLAKDKNVSAHYLIPQSNDPTYAKDEIDVVQLVDESKRAWHAGSSYWQGHKGLNDQSIGIELVYLSPCAKQEFVQNIEQAEKSRKHQQPHGLNRDNDPSKICFYPDFDPKQIDKLTDLIKDILARNPEITPDRIIGHSDITPDRRVDPGPRFPWQQLHKSGIGAWYDDDSVGKYWKLFDQAKPNIGLVQAALRAYGYGVIETGILDAPTINALNVFQMHFRPWQVDGQPTDETVATLFALIEKYREGYLEALLLRYQKEKIEANYPKEPPVNGQLIGLFPANKPSERQWVNNRSTFKAYKGTGKLVISRVINSPDLDVNDSHKTDHDDINSVAENNELELKTIKADLYINGQRLKRPIELKGSNPAFSQTIDIGQYTKDGINLLKIENINPKQSQLQIVSPYPTLSKGTPESVGFSKAKLAKIDQLINQEISEGFPGAALLIARKGKIIKNTAYGFAKRYNRQGAPLENPIPMTPTTLFDLASNTKMYATNYALMKLASEGKINVNLPVSHYLKEYRGSGRESRTIKDLLTHSAGYPPVVNFQDENNLHGTQFYSHNKAKTQQLLIEKVPFDIGKGLKTKYSDVDYLLLGTLVERIVGLPLDTYVEEQIYQPMGLNHTVFNPLTKGFNKNEIAATELQGNTRGGRIHFDGIREAVVHGNVHDEKAFYSMQGVAGHAGLFSNTEDVAKLASVILNRGGYGSLKLFDKNQLDQFMKPSELNITMGLGWRRAGNGERAWQFGPYASPYAIGHTGWTGTVTIIDPFYDLVIVLLTNKKHSKIVNIDDGSSNGVGIVSKTDNYEFTGDTFETGKYGSIVSLVYESFLER